MSSISTPQSNPFAALAPKAEEAKPVRRQKHGATRSSIARQRIAKKGHSLFTADEQVIIRALYFENRMSPTEIAAHTGLEPKQLYDWLHRTGWSKQRREALALAAQGTEAVAARLVERNREALEEIADATVRETQKEMEALARTSHPGKRLVHARIASTLMSTHKIASPEESAGSKGFGWDFMDHCPIPVKRAVPVEDSVRNPVRPALTPGETP